MNKFDISKIEECIKGILDEADLKSISAKAVRLKLQEKLSEDFTEDKSNIDKLIMKLYNERLPKSDDESNSLDVKKIDVKSKKRKKITTNKEEPKNKKMAESNLDKKNGGLTINKDEDAESSSDSVVNNDNDDAEIARALQAEINGMRNVRKSTLLTSKKSKENKKTKSEKGPPRRVGGFCKTQNLSEHLAEYLGVDKMPRHDVVKRFWDIAKEKNMFDPSNRQYVLCNDDWQRLFTKKRIRMFTISKYLEKHFIKND